MDNPLAVISVVFLGLILFGVPMAYSMILTAATYFLVLNPLIATTVIPQRGIAIISESFTLLAVPLFLLAGDLLNISGMTERLVDFAVAATGHIRGGVGHAVVVANIIMAGMSGSATADAAGIGSMMIPALKKANFRTSTATALCAASASIGPIIPPSIPFVIYSSMTGVSLGRLFLAGFIPGIIMGLFLMLNLYLSPETANTLRGSFHWRRVLSTGRHALLSLVLPVIILGGMFGGIYTPTEASAVAVAYAVFVGGLVYRTLTPASLMASLKRTAIVTGAVMFIVASANALSWVITIEHAGEVLEALFGPLQASGLATLLVMTLIVLFLGCFVDVSALLIVLPPVLAPVAIRAGIDPIHFALVFVLAAVLGLITPPVGMSMFVTCSIAGISTAQFARAVWRPFAALVLSLLVIIIWEDAVLFLPNLIMGK